MEIKSDCVTIALRFFFFFSLVPQRRMCGIRNAQVEVVRIPFVRDVPPNDRTNNENALKVLSNKGTKLLSQD